MEARLLSENEVVRSRIRALTKDGTKSISGVASEVGINRATVSKFVNGTEILGPDKLEALRSYAEQLDGGTEDAGPEPGAVEDGTTDSETCEFEERRFGVGCKIYYTEDYSKAMGMLNLMRRNRAQGVMLGHPGTGKTTVLREYVRTHPNAYYIDCWPFMGTRDLLEAIAESMGLTLKSGTRHQMEMQILRELQKQPGALLIFDEAENLIGENAKKIDTIRKLCDNSRVEYERGSGTACLLAGTMVLGAALERGGNGPKNLAQIYRRDMKVEMKGVNPGEVTEMLRGYNVDEGARAELTRIATDAAHGGLGNFVEILNICLNVTQGGTVTREVLRNAMKYKLMPR